MWLDCARKQMRAALKIYTMLDMMEERLCVLSNIATLYFSRLKNRDQSQEKALKIFKLCAREADSNNCNKVQAKCLTMISRIYFTRQSEHEEADKQEAITYLEEACNLYEKIGDKFKLANQRCNLANILIHTPYGNVERNLSKAEAVLINARDEFIDLKRTDCGYKVDIALGDVYFRKLTGDKGHNFRQALSHYENAIQNNAMAKEDKATILNRIGIICRRHILGNPLDNLKSAIIYFERAIKLTDPKNQREVYCNSYSNMGHTYRNLYTETGNQTYLLKAQACFETSLSYCPRSDDKDAWASYMNGLGLSYLDQIKSKVDDSYNKASSCFEKCLEIWSPTNRPVDYARACLNYGRLFSKAKNFHKAVTFFEKGIVSEVQISKPWVFRDICQELGNAQLSMGLYSEALKAYDLAEKADRGLWRRAILDESKRQECKAGAEIYFNKSWCLAKLGKNLEGLMALENGKCRSLSEKIEFKRLEDAPLLPEEKRELKTALEIINKTREEQDLSQINSNELLQAQKLIDRLAAKYSPAFFTELLNKEDLNSLITSENTVILEYNVTKFGAVVFLIYKIGGSVKIDAKFIDNFTQNDLQRITIKWLGKYQEFKQTQNPTDDEIKNWSDHIENLIQIELSRTLPPAVVPEDINKKIRQFILIPISTLHLFPLHMFTDNMENGHEISVSYVPSLTILANSLKNKSESSSFLGVSGMQEDVNKASELQNISRFFKESKIIGAKDLKINQLLTELKQHDYIYFYCHGEFCLDEPRKSCLFLNKGGVSDLERASISKLSVPTKKLALPDVFNQVELDKAWLVVLAACESGVSYVAKGTDEVFSFPAAFLYAGATHVVASFWKVRSDAVNLFMTSFYEALQSKSVAEALRIAKNRLKNDAVFKNPVYWSAFYLTAGR